MCFEKEKLQKQVKFQTQNHTHTINTHRWRESVRIKLPNMEKYSYENIQQVLTV